MSSIEKNPNYEDICKITNFELQKITSFAPIVSVEVERSFSLYKNLLRDNGQSFTESNLKMFHNIQFKSFM